MGGDASKSLRLFNQDHTSLVEENRLLESKRAMTSSPDIRTTKHTRTCSRLYIPGASVEPPTHTRAVVLTFLVWLLHPSIFADTAFSKIRGKIVQACG